MLVVKFLNPILFNVEMSAKSEEAGMRPTAGGLLSHSGDILVCHDCKVQKVNVEGELV